MGAMLNLWSNRFVAVAAISGALILFAGTYLHPMDADPSVASAAFTEYAVDHYWVTSHLMQLLGIALIVAALALLSKRLAGGPADAAATLGSVGAVASLALAGALQAVDGVALKAMVNAWAVAAEPQKEILFHAALAVRQIEIGLASITCSIMGLAVSIYGIALLTDPRFPKWLGFLALLGGSHCELLSAVATRPGRPVVTTRQGWCATK